MSGEVWYGVGPKDVFPETFGPFLLGKPKKTASWRGMCLMCFLMTRRRGLGCWASEGFGALTPASYCQRPRNRRGPIPQILALLRPRRRDSKAAMRRKRSVEGVVYWAIVLSSSTLYTFVEAVKKRFSRITRWIAKKINASKRRIRHDLAQGKGSSTLEVTQILRIVWFFYSLVRPRPHEPGLRLCEMET
jgi:hypothetical protein